VAALLGDPDVMAYYPAPKTRDQAQAWIEWNKANYAQYGYGLWIIETLDGEFVGDCGLTWQDVGGRRELEVGYHVRAAAQAGATRRRRPPPAAISRGTPSARRSLSPSFIPTTSPRGGWPRR
jgi:hypothetical protein